MYFPGLVSQLFVPQSLKEKLKDCCWRSIFTGQTSIAWLATSTLLYCQVPTSFTVGGCGLYGWECRCKSNTLLWIINSAIKSKH